VGESVMKVAKVCFKVIAAGLVSIVIICGLLFFYNILPVHEENTKGNTDYVWPPNSIWVKATEGISFGKNDANGFNNISVVENPDIIILGSSHMEATNVMQDENAAYLLSKRLTEKYSVYNMGISGHNFFKVCQYIPANLKLYDKTPKMVIIETSTVDISQNSVDEVISSSVEHTPSHNTGIIGKLQKVPFLRALYHQMEGGLLDLFMPKPNEEKAVENNGQTASQEEDNLSSVIDHAAYTELFSYLRKMEEEYDTQILIFYHPTEKLMSDGTIYFDRSEYLKEFTEYANNYDITFIDMTDRFEKMYYEENHVAHGFCTGQLATGHINKYGHAAVADELYKAINKLEEDGELCQ
jgi:hypothetical protein